MSPSTTESHPPVQAFIGLGANLGDARATLQAALTALAALPNTVLRQSSPVYRSAPLESSGPNYFNAVAWLDTHLDPHALLAELQRIEQAHGRERPYRNAPRTLDLDLLLYGEQRIDSATLTVPHPRLHERAFVVRPLADIAPDLSVPGFGPVQNLLARVADQQADKLPS
jgi:2-amino-4-hydroxy-6-hydroxymethyldihydropteridine diphosphokinase